MGIAERYILNRVVLITLTTLVSLVTIVLITQVLIFVNVVTNSGEAIRTFMTMAAMLVPMVTGIVLPFALVIGVSNALNQMHADSEIVVLEGAGVSRSVAIKPVMMLAVVASLLSLFNSLVIEPAANRQLRDIITQVRTDMIGMAVRSEAFLRLDDNLYLQIGGQLPGGTFESIFISDLRDPESELLYYAQRGSITDFGDTKLLVLQDGEVHRSNARTGEVSIISYAAYAIDLTQFTSAAGGNSYQPKEMPLSDLLDPDPNGAASAWQPRQIKSELHRRLSDWLYPLALVPIALYFSAGARSNRQERVWSLMGAAGAALAVRGTGFFVVEQSGNSAMLGVLPYAVPVASLIFFCALLASGKRMSLPQNWLDRISDATDAINRTIMRILRRPLAKEGGK